MTTVSDTFAPDHDRLLASLRQSDNLLIIQDLDGVCMGLVRDPLTRTIDRGYVEAARALAGRFYVLTNGEHTGPRGVNTIVERAFDSAQSVREKGLYLPGLAAGGVQLQDRYGHVSHPGVTDREMAFLQAVPGRAERFLVKILAQPPYDLESEQIDAAVRSAVLDNPLSPTINLGVLQHHLRDRPACYRALQQCMGMFMDEFLADAEREGLRDAFFVHYAPNLGRDANGVERISLSDDEQAGTSDFQFMLRGGVKEAGVLMILNHYVHAQTGVYPLGEDFNVRQAPRGHQALLQLVRDRFDAAQMPRILGVGDTLTSQRRYVNGEPQWLRGGSDRGFLQLVQDIGNSFHTDNVVVFVDSSGGEVQRPGVAAAGSGSGQSNPAAAAGPALKGISDADDPLHLDAVFAGGHAQYVTFFRALTRDRSPLHR